MAQKADVTVYGISTKNFSGITTGMVEGSDDKELRKLCEDTGGQLFLPSEKMQLFKSFTQVATDLRQEYVLYYTPMDQNRSGKFRSIKVRLLKSDGDPFHKKGYTY